MPDVIVTVRGEFSALYPAERAMVKVSAQTAGADRDSVFGAAIAAAESLRAQLPAALAPSKGPISEWSSDEVRVWSEHHFTNDGAVLPRLFHSRVEFSITFSDLGALAPWIESAVAIPSVSIDTISWDLTEASRATATAAVREGAVRDAVARATAYSASLGLGPVSPRAIADQGMLDSGSAGGGPVPLARTAMQNVAYVAGGKPGLELNPQAIAVASVVDARFTAS